MVLSLFLLFLTPNGTGCKLALAGGKMIDVHATHISRYECNLTSLTIDMAKKIADALEVSTDSLIYGSDEQIVNNKLNDAELLQLFNKVQQLSGEDITSVKDILR